jgi:hypothetical protein
MFMETNSNGSMTGKPFLERLSDGIEFEDFVVLILYQNGWPIIKFNSRKYQWTMGESVAHVEIKHDHKFNETGNLFIETEERRDAGNSTWRPAGIYDASDPWFYVIGDKKTLFIFSVALLRLIKSRYRFVLTDTAKGFLFPLEPAGKYAIRVLKP